MSVDENSDQVTGKDTGSPLELAEPQPAETVAPEDPIADAQPRRRGRGPILAVLALVVVGFAAAWFDVAKLRGPDPLPALQAEVDALGARVAQADAQSQEIAALAARIDGLAKVLESTPAPVAGDVSASSFADLTNAVAALKAELAAIKATPGSAAAGDIRAEVDRAMAAWADEQSAKLQADSEAAKAKGATIEAVQRIRAASLSGAPYADSLPALSGVSVDPLITGQADTGLMTRAQLAEAFPDPARRALDASLRASDGGGFWGFLRIQTGARSLEPREGDDPDAVLSRAEAAVIAGDISGALSELDGLPAEGQAQMADWVSQAEQYLATEKALTALAASVGL